MVHELQTVQPGDLITSEFMNMLIEKLKSLENRIAALEALGPGGEAVIVISLFPPGPLRLGQELQITGRNFDLTTGSSIVFVDDVLVTAFKSGSDDELLIFDIPNVPNVPLAGRTATLTVGNQTSSTQRTIFLLPAQQLQGVIEVTWMGVAPTTLNPNNPATFQYRLRSRTNIAATYTISSAISVPDNPQEWLSRIEVLDNVQNPIASRTIFLEAGEDTIFHVRINPIPAVPGDTPFILAVNASADSVSGSSGPINITLGEAVEMPDQGVSMSFQAAEFDPVGSGSIVPGTIQDTIRLMGGSTSQITFLGEFREVGTYDVLISPIGDTTANWNLRRHPQSAASYTITAAMLDNPQGKHDETPRYLITPQAGASATGEVEFKIRGQGADRSRSLRMRLELGA